MAHGRYCPALDAGSGSLAPTNSPRFSPAAGAAAGAWLAGRLRAPAPYLLGPLAVTAMWHLSGVIEAKLPFVWVIAMQVVVGAGIGSTFVGTRLRDLALIFRTKTG